MEATPEDIAGLLELQNYDLDIKRRNKELDELPQRGIIIACREKRQAFEEKGEKIAELKRETKRKLTRIEDEDASLAKKENGVQAAIDNAHGDYRNVEARTKELAGIVRRRGVLAEDREGVEAELARITAIEDQVNRALAEIGAKEQAAIDSFQKQGGDLKLAVAKAEAQRDKRKAAIDPALVDVYERTSARSGGVAVSTLEDNRCGACRATIDGGRLIDLRNQAPLGVCPSCKRLLIIT